MIVNFYQTNSPRNMVNKSLQLIKSVDAKIPNLYDFIRPSLKVKSQINFNYNYIEIPDLNRFYFITAYEKINSSITRLHLVCDVLSTYKNSVIGANALFNRKLKEGDFHAEGLESTSNVNYSEYYSDIEFFGKGSIIVNTIGYGSQN